MGKDKKKKKIAKETKKESLIDRLKFMQKDKGASNDNKNRQTSSTLHQNGTSDLPIFFKMVQ
jgi:hypothetical protein